MKVLLLLFVNTETAILPEGERPLWINKKSVLQNVEFIAKYYKWHRRQEILSHSVLDMGMILIFIYYERNKRIEIQYSHFQTCLGWEELTMFQIDGAACYIQTKFIPASAKLTIGLCLGYEVHVCFSLSALLSVSKREELRCLNYHFFFVQDQINVIISTTSANMMWFLKKNEKNNDNKYR